MSAHDVYIAYVYNAWIAEFLESELRIASIIASETNSEF